MHHDLHKNFNAIRIRIFFCQNDPKWVEKQLYSWYNVNNMHGNDDANPFFNLMHPLCFSFLTSTCSFIAKPHLPTKLQINMTIDITISTDMKLKQPTDNSQAWWIVCAVQAVIKVTKHLQTIFRYMRRQIIKQKFSLSQSHKMTPFSKPSWLRSGAQPKETIDPNSTTLIPCFDSNNQAQRVYNKIHLSSQALPSPTRWAQCGTGRTSKVHQVGKQDVTLQIKNHS
jgi:hypothetical protein